MTEVTNKLVEQVVDSLLTKVKKEIGFTWNCKENVDKLRSEKEKLKSMMMRVQQRIKAANDKGDKLRDGVQKWVDEADATKNLNELDTHESALENVIKAIEDESIQLIGIYGTGGVGKTTLAKEAAAMVKHLFDLVVFVSVSQSVNATHIRTGVEVAAKRIMRGEDILIILDDVWRELKLDEMGIPFGTDYPNCKILLTSRKSSVCGAMNAGRVICVDTLPIREAWIFFKRVVGEKVETDAKLKQVAMNVAKGCGGLPLILEVVGEALKNERIMEWEAALDRLQKHATPDIDPNVRLAFAHLKLSYDYLESKEVKSCFLLCSMFPEDYDISLETLAFYGVGLQFFKDLDSLEDARNRVRLAVKILKSSCLLLDAKDEFTTKMHDIVREVALLIASKDNNKFLVKAGKDLKEWEPRNGSMESYTGISLMENDICKLTVGHELKIPLLNIFLLQKNLKLSEISEEFILAVKEVRVIDFEYNNITSLPKSLKRLTRLCMLNLGGNRFLRDVSILGELTLLEILILNGTGIREIPKEIGKLVNLRLLHVEYCLGLSHIAPGVLSKLRWLEELHIGYYPVERGNRNGLVEIYELSKRAFLKLSVPHIYLSPRGDFLAKLNAFYIKISHGVVNSHMISRDRKTLLLEKQHIDISDLSQVKKLTEVSNVIKVNIIGSNDYNNLMPMMYSEGSGLKFIYVSKCHELLCLLDSRVLDEMQPFNPSKTHEGVKEKRKFLSEVEHLELLDLSCLNVILRCPDQYISLINLVNLVINNCPKLEKLLNVGVAQGLVKLQKLEIVKCKSLKEVISDGDEETTIGEIVLPCLAEIVLSDLNNLESFFPGNAIIKYPSLVKVEIKDCNRLKNWGYGTHDTPNLQFINNTKANGSIVDGILAKYKEDELWRVEVFQKIQAMKDLYLHDLNDIHQKVLGKLQKHYSLPQQPKNEQLEKLKVFKNMLERFMAFLQIPKQNILDIYRDKLVTYKTQMVRVINSSRRNPGAPQQQGQALPPQHMQSQQSHSQSHDNQMSSQMQTGNMQGSMGGMQQNNMGMSGPQQVNMNPMSSHSGSGTVQPDSNMIDRIAGSVPAVGEDLVAMTKSRLQARTSDTQDGTNGARKMKHCAMPLNVLSPAIKRRRLEKQCWAWAIKMRVFMQAQGVWDAVEPRTSNTVVEVKKDKMALAAIYQGIPEDLLLSLAEKKTAKEAWEALKTMFMGADRVKTARIQTLKAEFEAMNMKETEGVDEFAAKVTNIVSTMRTLGDSVDESYVVKKLLRAVSTKFLQIASTLEQFGDLDNMTVEEVIGRLKAHDRMIERKKTEGESKSKSNRGGFGGSRGQGRGRGRSNGGRGTRGRGGSHYHKDGGRGSSSSQDKSKIQCYNCQEYGHYAAECTNPRRERSHENNLIREENEPALLLSALEDKGEVFLNEENVNPRLKTGNGVVDQSKLWYLDTGASNHMTGDKEKFRDLHHHKFGLISECGDEIKIKEPFLWVRDKEQEDCHLNFGALKTMSDKNMVEGMPKLYVPTQPCEGCLVSKDEAFQVFKNFRGLVEVETGEKMKLFRTDRGGEFLSNQFTSYCNETGLERHYTSPYSPQQNGVVERRNRTVVEMVRSNLKTMVTSKALKDSTPYEMWTGRKAHLGHLRVFGNREGVKSLSITRPGHREIVREQRCNFRRRPSLGMGEKHEGEGNSPGMSFTIEGFNTDEFYDDDFEPEPDSPQSDQIASQSDSVWAPKRYRLLTDLYDETEEIDELMMIRNDEEPNQTGPWIDLPKESTKRYSLKWVYKVKRDPSRKTSKYKARVVVKGYVQKRGVDYDEVFAPVARIETKKKYMYRSLEDDLIVTGSCHKSIQDFKRDMRARFGDESLGLLSMVKGELINPTQLQEYVGGLSIGHPRKSSGGKCVLWGIGNLVIGHLKQRVVHYSSCDAGVYCCNYGGMSGIWLRRLLTGDNEAKITTCLLSSEGGDGTVVICSFSAVAVGPNLKSQYASSQMSPIQSIRLLVPANYPYCSPIVLDMFPAEASKEYEDLSTKTMSRFRISLRSLSQPMSLKEIAKTWDVCARAVFSDYAQPTHNMTPGRTA
ncbi:NB-ARC domains-containing protein [Tanacetum coccineum]